MSSTSRKPREDGRRTRQTILLAAARLATVEGLEGLSIGALAESIGMSKSGLYAHFGSKEELQLATIEAADGIFNAEVIAPALAAPPGRARLVAVGELFFEHLRRRTFPGGCFFAGAVMEMGTRQGRVRDRIAAFQADLVGLLVRFAEEAGAAGELDEDPRLLAFELNGIFLAADASFVMSGSDQALELARAALHRRLGVTSSPD